ncbi:glycosyltransferase family 4 protein [Staphylospora marina]|uniref:glycosyltransferase family 4 protein n=1 Tax=Staphylospora marina TaxID=2490858 RepID=UPI000F5BED11|nr:glycosyltransferase family 4 protein [Staphylospora marina]
MRIWLVNHYAVPPNIAGITRHYELAREWATEEGSEVTLFLSSFVHPRRTFVTEEEKNELENIPGLKLNWLWSFPHKVNDFRRIINMGSFAAVFFLSGLFKRKPDVLVASSPHLFTAFAGWMLAKLKGCPFVFEVRDLWPDSLIKMGGLNNRHVIRLLTWMEQWLYEKSDRIVVLTEHQRKYIMDRGIDESRITLIPNGIVVGSWTPDPSKRAEYRRKMGLTGDGFVAVYTGAHGPANALEHVVKAGKHLKPGISIVLIGDGPEKEKLIRLKREEGLDNVHLLDPVPKAEIFDYTQAADVGIISLADNEIFRGARPNKLFDYAFIGLPIVTTVDGEVREIVEGNGLGFFAGAENPEGLAEAIDRARALTDEEREEIKKRGRDYIDREGDRKKLARKFHELLRELVSGKEEPSKRAETAG